MKKKKAKDYELRDTFINMLRSLDESLKLCLCSFVCHMLKTLYIPMSQFVLKQKSPAMCENTYKPILKSQYT